MFKKLSGILILAVFLLSIAACNAPKEDVGLGMTDDLAPITKDEQGYEIQGVTEQTPTIETEKEGKERYNSLEEMIDAAEVGAGNATNSVQTSVEQSDLEKYYDYFYVPTAIPDEYALSHITVSKYNIQYRYRLISNPDDHTMSITVTFDNPNQFLNKNPMQAAVDQIGIPLTEDGYLYYPELRDIFFPVGGSSMCIRVPESMNTYEQLKPLCVATKYTVENGDSSLVTE